MLELIFWGMLLLLFYTYLGYPLALMILNKIPSIDLNQKKNLKTDRLPIVSILIAAYNEEKVIADKIENCLKLDYPIRNYNIWIASDGSSDRTNEIVKNYAVKNEKIHLLEFPRIGKAMVLNKAMSDIKSEIVVFSDANTEFKADVLKNLVRRFKDRRIGCVCGRLVYRNPTKGISGVSESAYWRYETALKKMESKVGYVSGANGAIYAIRRELFEPLSARTINDDFEISMKIVKGGFRCIYEEQAIAYEDVAPAMKSEFKRHVRDGAGHYIAVINLIGLLNPFIGIRSFIYWSHRIFRWSAPFLLILLLILNIVLLDRELYKNFLILQLSFYFFAIAGWISIQNMKNRRIPFFMYVPFYFCNLNTALLLGFFKAVTGMQKTTWERTERIG